MQDKPLTIGIVGIGCNHGAIMGRMARHIEDNIAVILVMDDHIHHVTHAVQQKLNEVPAITRPTAPMMLAANPPLEFLDIKRAKIRSLKPKVENTRVIPISRNASCPCGSGRKYKRCCNLKTQ